MSRSQGVLDNAMPQQIEALCREMTTREEAGDADAEAWFDHLLSDDFVIRQAGGAFQGKRRFISDLKHGAARRRVTEFPVTVLHAGEVSVAWLTIAVGSQRVRHVRVFRQASAPGQGQGGWILEMWNNTELRTPPSTRAGTDAPGPGSSSGPSGARGIGSHLI